MSESPSRAEPGAVLNGRYRLDRALAVGGMARVWAGHDAALGRPVAIKILLEHLAEDETFVSRFRSEAIAAARLAHPSVVSIYDTCSTAGIEAIVMELIHGETLRHRLDRGRLQPSEAARIGARVAEGLNAAHQAGIIHRDIKPANVMLAENRVVVTDFGIAKATSQDELTTTGQTLGTAKYLAPEQVRGDILDGRADLYALGTVLFEALSGDVPFRAENDAATALARLNQSPPDVTTIVTGIPTELGHVVNRLLCADLEQRWPDAHRLARALEPISRGEPIPHDLSSWVSAPYPASSMPIPLPTQTESPLAPSSLPFEQPIQVPSNTKRGRRRRRITTALISLSILLALVAVALTFFPLTHAATLKARAFDPYRTDGENDANAIYSVDGNAETFWSTERYSQTNFPGEKTGVGLILTLPSTERIEKLKITSSTSRWDAAIYVLDQVPIGPVDQKFSPDASGFEIGPTKTFSLHGVSGRAVVLWITRTGNDGTVVLNEVKALVRS